MSYKDYELKILEECFSPEGFVDKFRGGNIDRVSFERLIEGVVEFGQLFENEQRIPKILVSALFEVPWEMENAANNFFRTRDEEQAKALLRMAESLREATNEAFGNGLNHEIDVFL